MRCRKVRKSTVLEAWVSLSLPQLLLEEGPQYTRVFPIEKVDHATPMREHAYVMLGGMNPDPLQVDPYQTFAVGSCERQPRWQARVGSVKRPVCPLRKVGYYFVNGDVLPAIGAGHLGIEGLEMLHTQTTGATADDCKLARSALADQEAHGRKPFPVRRRDWDSAPEPAALPEHPVPPPST